MLTTAFINFAYFLINGLISFLPTGGTFSSTIHTATQSLGGYLHIIDPLVPISTLAAAIALLVSVEIAIFGFRTLKWVFSHIPWIGGRGK